MKRRSFLQGVGLGLGAAAGLIPGTGAAGQTTARRSGGPDVVVVGAGVFGVWTALKLQSTGAQVLLVDAFGPGNSRASSGGGAIDWRLIPAQAEGYYPSKNQGARSAGGDLLLFLDSDVIPEKAGIQKCPKKLIVFT